MGKTDTDTGFTFDDAPTLVMSRTPRPFVAAEELTLVDAEPATPTLIASPAPVAARPPQAKTAAQPPRPAPRPAASVPRPRARSVPPPLPSSARPVAKAEHGPVAPLPLAARRPATPRSAAPLQARA